ncbi:MAG: hypothetical protein H6738_09740 [Alphaproteobacteria bacterium]|nr:hypothetical protein [Alphaproteobacteria bacterium]MCB9697047.1 hypothetical protein [Alphaproteobacteria bacterium]
MSTRTDGIRTSHRPLGPVAQRWISILDGVDTRIRPRVVRGRTLARGGRVKDLELAPGAALGGVRDADEQRPTLRVRTFDDEEWNRIVGLLCERLDLLASLFEGEVADELLSLLEERGLPLLPSVEEIDGDCDCGDWAVPCAHGAALHHILGEVLEGEPFLLFTLRGRPREQLLTDLRRAWGDTGTRVRGLERTEEAMPDGDPFASPAPIPAMSFRFNAVVGSPGMVELGPLVGDDDLPRALAPLYDAGAAHALELALSELGDVDQTRRRRPTRGPRSAKPTKPPSPDETPIAPTPRPAMRREEVRPAPQRVVVPSEELAEMVVDAVADAEDGLSVDELVDQLGFPDRVLAPELRELERMGLLTTVDAEGVRRYHLG